MKAGASIGITKMADIFNIDVLRPHMAGTALCRNCDNRHVYVAPLLMTIEDWLHMECDLCHHMTCHDENFKVEWGKK